MFTLWVQQDITDDDTLATFWLHSGYFLATFWLYFGYILVTFWLHFGYVLATFWPHSGYILAIFWVHSGYILATFWLYFGYILARFWLCFGYNMNTFRLSQRLFSYVFWDSILSNTEINDGKRENLFFELSKLEKLREKADYNTGSISNAAAWCIYCVIKYFAPQKIMEIAMPAFKPYLTPLERSGDVFSWDPL